MKYFATLFLALILSACNSGTADSTETQVSNDLPDIPVRLTNGSFRQLNMLNGKAIVVLFQPDCDHCQREAASMSENLESFKSYQVYFISSAPLPALQQFAGTYGLKDASNFYFGTTDVNNIIEKFGSIPTPSMYIYSENGELLKEFIGEAPIEEILEAI